MNNSPPCLEHNFAEHLTTAVIVFDAELNVCSMNPAAEMLFAVSKKKMQGTKIQQLLRCPDQILDQHIGEAIGAGQPLTERELSLKVLDGRKIVVDCTIVPVKSDDELDYVLVEIQQLDRHLRISREELLLSQQQTTRDLVRSLAHEIKNPLGGLRGAAQLLAAELESDDLVEYTQVIIDEADRLKKLVDQLLGPNQINERQPVNIHRVLERVNALVSAEFAQTVRIKRDYDPSIPDVMADEDQLIQAILNIVSNAASLIADDNGLIQIKTRVLRHFTLGSVCHRLVAKIDIRDDGPGIKPDMQEKIFFPMVSGRQGGTGLGLSISQSLINRHQGLIECQSVPGDTVFTVYLPLGDS